ncbi:MAG: sodium/proton-translocating pyrophosphatase, partial [Planctomycetes bacterium]|nr:sodium/proton-translocating pyrophosphatase [Planctomycetota bacterium]
MSLVGLYFAAKFYREIMAAPEGTDRMKEIAQYVREGAYAYLYAQYKTVSIVFIVLFLVFLGLAYAGIQNPFVPVAFLTGGFFSGLCGFLGMKTATNASARTAQGASESLNRGLTVAFRAGAVMGLIVVSFGLLDICIWYWILDNLVYTADHMVSGWNLGGLWMVHPDTNPEQKFVEITTTMLTFGMGASTQALFARVGGGIYTKAADVGADLVGKVEAGIPEDDPRNPATIADNVGDNVGDVAGMGADLYESYCGSILATAALGAAIPALNPAMSAGEGIRLVIAPMVVAGIGTLLSIIGIYMVKTEEKADMSTLLKALGKAVNVSSALIIAVVFLLAVVGMINWGVFLAVVTGLLVGIKIGKSTEYYTSDEYEPTRSIAEQCKTGPATCIIAGLGVGMLSSATPVIVTVLGIILSYGFAGGFATGVDSTIAMAYGLYGIGFAAVGMLATLGVTLATDAYGPIADNA